MRKTFFAQLSFYAAIGGWLKITLQTEDKASDWTDIRICIQDNSQFKATVGKRDTAYRNVGFL